MFLFKTNWKKNIQFQEIKATFQEGFILDKSNSIHAQQYATRNVLLPCIPLTQEQNLTLFKAMCFKSLS